jgi:septum formation protein
MAREKAGAVTPEPGQWVLAADTVVHLDSEVLGKPVDRRDARRMLAALSGGWHRVTTGFCARRDGGEVSDTVTTRVRFRSLSAQLIASYVATQEPMDKAGAYGIQGLGSALVSEIVGSYTNVVGLPLAEVVEALALLGLGDPMEMRP